MSQPPSGGGTAPPFPGLEGVPGDIVYLRLPRPAELFERRAARFRELAPGNPMGEFLDALSHLARAQLQALSRLAPSIGSDAGLKGRRLAAAIPLRATAWQRDPAWREGLSALVSAMKAVSLPGPAAAALARLERAAPAELEALADALLSGEGPALDLGMAPFAAAALQVYFAALAEAVPAAEVERSHAGCPVCGSPPVAGVVTGDDRLRYLTCSLCGSEWNLTRVQCWDCRATGGITYLALDGEPGLKAELCAGCGTYLKLFYREKRPAAEPFADDVASLTLDLLAAEEGWARGGVNLFLLGGAEG